VHVNDEPTPPELTHPPMLLAIARAARTIGDHDLERAAVRMLRDEYGIDVRFQEPVTCAPIIQDGAHA